MSERPIFPQAPDPGAPAFPALLAGLRAIFELLLQMADTLDAIQRDQ